MFSPMLIFLYVALSFVVAFLGARGRLGYFWTFILSLLVTPLVVLLLHLVDRKWTKRRLRKARELIAKHELI